MIYRILYKLLHDSPNVANRVGTRIWAENAPSDPPPERDKEYIVLRNFSGSAESGLDGESDCGMPMVEVECHSSTADKAEGLHQLVRNRISGFRGDVAVVNHDNIEETITISEISLLRSGMRIESPADASDKWSYSHSSDFEVFHEQSVPTLT